MRKQEARKEIAAVWHARMPLRNQTVMVQGFGFQKIIDTTIVAAQSLGSWVLGPLGQKIKAECQWSLYTSDWKTDKSYRYEQIGTSNVKP